MNEQTKRGIYTQWHTCYSMNEPWKHYAKWNVRQKRINTAWFHLYEVSRLGKFIETASTVEVARGWGCGVWCVIVYWVRSFHLRWWKISWGREEGEIERPNHISPLKLSLEVRDRGSQRFEGWGIDLTWRRLFAASCEDGQTTWQKLRVTSK